MCQTCKAVRRDIKRGLAPGAQRAALEQIAAAMPRQPDGHFDELTGEVLGTPPPPDAARDRAWARSQR